MGFAPVVAVSLPLYEVVIATYNGAQFVEDQLATIVAQTWPPSRILIVDDGSDDGTLRILQRWQKSGPVAIELLLNNGRLGCCKTFERALLATTAEYVIPADQDDLWDSDKAERLLREIVRLEQCFSKDVPILVHTALRLIDQNGLLLKDLFHCKVGLNPCQDQWCVLALQNVVTGCSCVINRACLSQALPFPENVVLHDWWLALVAKRFGYIDFLPQPTVSYRQHGTNVVGAQSSVMRLRQSLYMVLKRKLKPGELIVPALAQLRAFYWSFPSQFSPVEQKRLEQLWAPAPVRRLNAAMRLRLKKQGWMRTLAFYACLVWPGALPMPEGEGGRPTLRM